jgi:hypothetical protein
MNFSAFAGGPYFLVLHFTADKDGHKLELTRQVEVVK